MTHTNLDFANKLLSWFDQSGRKDLPWQQNKTPYRVWVSEIMLQQTQVSSVIEYYQRFMTRFPTLESLAIADEDRVLELWAGLGYYARARNLHKTAKIIHQDLHGKFPDTLDSIIELPGIGRSTAGAILSIAFKQPATILDGNVKRVLCRFKAITTWSGERKTENQLWALAEQLTPSTRTDDYTQAIMDLGATLCTRSKPDCKRCPMSQDCQALKLDLQTELPKSKPKKAIPLRHTRIILIETDDKHILLEKRPPTGIWGGLYSLPEFNIALSLKDITQHCSTQFSCSLSPPIETKVFQHTFSHFKLELQPIAFKSANRQIMINDSDRFLWIKLDQLDKLGMPAPIAKYLKRCGHIDIN
ncbi:MAG: A/G-specific adenine glycosylase [Oleiphilaceae bacterium]|jgi:A/G-specific adenine glycosylase